MGAWGQRRRGSACGHPSGAEMRRSGEGLVRAALGCGPSKFPKRRQRIYDERDSGTQDLQFPFRARRRVGRGDGARSCCKHEHDRHGWKCSPIRRAPGRSPTMTSPETGTMACRRRRGVAVAVGGYFFVIRDESPMAATGALSPRWRAPVAHRSPPSPTSTRAALTRKRSGGGCAADRIGAAWIRRRSSGHPPFRVEGRIS